MELLPLGGTAKQFTNLKKPLWTENKARLIARYLTSFTYVTRHGTYVDVFAGPQHSASRAETWAANLVLRNEPQWLRNFHFFEKNPAQVKLLESLKTDYATPISGAKRTITVTRGDSNIMLPQFLRLHPFKEREASFCLFDQWSTECDWETVKTVAAHKGARGGHKIELFYFLAQTWMNRALKSRRKNVPARFRRWWGADDLKEFLVLRSYDRGQRLVTRFKNELGYKHACAFPIQKAGKKGRTMFWMIHASDHDRAIALMHDAYNFVGAGGSISDPIAHQELLKME